MASFRSTYVNLFLVGPYLLVQSYGSDFGEVCPKGAMSPRALDADHDASVDDPPLRILCRTVSTRLIGRVHLKCSQDSLGIVDGQQSASKLHVLEKLSVL